MAFLKDSAVNKGGEVWYNGSNGDLMYAHQRLHARPVTLRERLTIAGGMLATTSVAAALVVVVGTIFTHNWVILIALAVGAFGGIAAFAVALGGGHAWGEWERRRRTYPATFHKAIAAGQAVPTGSNVYKEIDGAVADLGFDGLQYFEDSYPQLLSAIMVHYLAACLPFQDWLDRENAEQRAHATQIIREHAQEAANLLFDAVEFIQLGNGLFQDATAADDDAEEEK